MSRTKIVATIGPATSQRERIADLIRAGMDVARLNFSHGSHADHGAVIDTIRSVAAELDRHIAILQDLQGPKIRIGTLAAPRITLARDARVTVTTRPVVGDEHLLSTVYEHLPKDVVAGDRLLLSDGLVELRAVAVDDTDIDCVVTRPGLVGERSGLNLPGVRISAPSLTEKDLEDLRFGIERQVDYVAVSFVRQAEDLQAAKQLLAAAHADIPVVAKLERPESLDNLDAIMDVADAIMVARGDLGVEVSVERVPLLQKAMIARARRRSIPVITATQMLESMVHNQTPTRAEASDVANAILDGTDAVMLSGETAIGSYPIEAVATMRRIADAAETAPAGFWVHGEQDVPLGDYTHAIAAAAETAARTVSARAIVAFTQSGFTARLVSKHGVSVPIIAVSPSDRVARRVALYRGVVPQVAPKPGTIDEMLRTVTDTARRSGLVSAGDTILVIASSTTPIGGQTNLIEVRSV